jgi:replication factor C subunit 2/4
MLFYGPPGTGKTTTALALCNQLYGPKYLNERVLELNASDERGIKVVREKIKNFAKRRVNNEIAEKYKKKYPCPPYKIIILDEADAMTDESQFALRRIIEEYSIITRFFLICNYVSKINKPIISRCALYRFKPLSKQSINILLKQICKIEDMELNDLSILKILDYCDGDLRKAINTLQRLKFISVNKIDDNILDEISIKLSMTNFTNLVNILLKDSSYSNINKVAKYFVKKGYGVNIILREMTKKIIDSKTLSDLQKSLLFLKLSDLDYLLNNGSDEELILINYLTYFARVLNKYE